MNDVAFSPEVAGLEALDARVHRDLTFLNHPAPNWVPAKTGPEGEPVTDVVVIGGGMCGLVASFGLLRAGIRNIRILDRSPEGREGPWVTYARMETLRSPKQLTGPAYGMASLTFRAFYEAQYGRAAWDDLGKIPRTMWMDYLAWYRRVLDLPVENGIEVLRIEPEGALLRLDLAGAAERSILCRRVVMATGRDGLGRPKIPSFVRDLPRTSWAHSSDDIDFAALRGKRVAVIGAGASAVDNAATALEAGAARVQLIIRRSEMPRINKLMGIGSFGFSAGYAAASDAWRWRIMHYSFATQTPAPRDSTLRVSAHANASFHLGCAVVGMDYDGEQVVITTSRGRTFEADLVILGTGFTVEADSRPELGVHAAAIASWQDRYQPPPELASTELAAFPYLARDFSFTERTPGEAPWLSRIACFNYGATLSMGKVSGDIPGISDGARWLVRGLAASLYDEDIDLHWQQLRDYAKPELLGDEWTDAEA